jgi:O-antigen ligase
MYRVTAQAANVHGDLTREWLIDAHNLFLQVLCETGVVGLAGFLTVVGVSVYALVRRIRAGSGDSARGVLDALAFYGVVAILVLGIVHFPLHHAPVALVFWTLMGVAGLP